MLQELSKTRTKLYNVLILTTRRELIDMAYSWGGHKDCDFTGTTKKDIVELILDALGVEDEKSPF